MREDPFLALLKGIDKSFIELIHGPLPSDWWGALSFGAKVLLSGGLLLFAAGLTLAIFGISYGSITPSYAGSVLAFLGGLFGILGLMGEGGQAKDDQLQLRSDVMAVRTPDKN